MKITIELFGRFKDAVGKSHLEKDLPEGTTVGELYDLLKIEDQVYRMALVNGFRVQDNRRLEEGDNIHIFQPVGGG